MPLSEYYTLGKNDYNSVQTNDILPLSVVLKLYERWGIRNKFSGVKKSKNSPDGRWKQQCLGKIKRCQVISRIRPLTLTEPLNKLLKTENRVKEREHVREGWGLACASRFYSPAAVWRRRVWVGGKIFTSAINAFKLINIMHHVSIHSYSIRGLNTRKSSFWPTEHVKQNAV